jgi:hypothetical protein
MKAYPRIRGAIFLEVTSGRLQLAGIINSLLDVPQMQNEAWFRRQTWQITPGQLNCTDLELVGAYQRNYEGQRTCNSNSRRRQ